MPGAVRQEGRALAYGAAVLAVFGWGSLYPAAKVALEEVTPLMIVAARAGVACLVLAALTCLRYGGLGAGYRRLRAEARYEWGGPCALGMISLVGTSLLAMTAQETLPAGVNGLLNNLSPLWLALYATVAGRARHPLLLLAGSAVAAGGVATVLLGDALFFSAPAGGGGEVPAEVGFVLDGGTASGVILSVGGSVLIAYSNLVARRVMAGRDPFATTAVAAGWATVPLVALLSLGVGGSISGYATASAATQGLLVWLGAGATAFNFSLWFFALAHLPVTRIANFQYLIPPLGVALAVALLGEPAGPGLLVGTGAVLAGIALAQRGAEPAAGG